MVPEEVLLNSVDVLALPGQGYSFTAEQFLTRVVQGPRLALHLDSGGRKALPPPTPKCLHFTPSLCLLFPMKTGSLCFRDTKVLVLLVCLFVLVCLFWFLF